jgi:Phage integrase family
VTVPVLGVLEACRGQRASGPLVLRPVSGQPIDRRDVYRMVARIAKAAQIPRHISPPSLRHATITNALDAGVPLRDAQILARHADPRTTEHYDRARGNLDRLGVHFLTAYVAGVGTAVAGRSLAAGASFPPTMGHKRVHPSSAPTRCAGELDRRTGTWPPIGHRRGHPSGT